MLFIRFWLFLKKLRIICHWFKTLDADPRAIQQIIFTGKSSANIVVYYVLEQSKETILQFSKGTTNVLWVNIKLM